MRTFDQWAGAIGAFAMAIAAFFDPSIGPAGWFIAGLMFVDRCCGDKS